MLSFFRCTTYRTRLEPNPFDALFNSSKACWCCGECPCPFSLICSPIIASSLLFVNSSVVCSATCRIASGLNRCRTRVLSRSWSLNLVFSLCLLRIKFVSSLFLRRSSLNECCVLFIFLSKTEVTVFLSSPAIICASRCSVRRSSSRIFFVSYDDCELNESPIELFSESCGEELPSLPPTYFCRNFFLRCVVLITPPP